MGISLWYAPIYRVSRELEVQFKVNRLLNWWDRNLPSKVNKLKIEISISLRTRDEEVKIYGKSDC